MNLMLAVILSLFATGAFASELIKIYSPYSPGHSGSPALRRVVEEANTSQSIYNFVVEFRPGGNQIIAVKSMERTNSLAIIAPAYVENIDAGQLNEQDYIPVHAFGDACWAVVTNKPFTGATDFVVAGVGIGNATHLTALALGKKYKFDVRYVLFKSNYDGLINMTGNNGVEFVIDKYESYEALRTKNQNMNMVAASCPTRLPQAPNVKTLKELGVAAPYIFNITIAHRDMPVTRRVAIAKILNDATLRVGQDEIYRLSAMQPPIFKGISAEQFYKQSVDLVRALQIDHKRAISQSKQ